MLQVWAKSCLIIVCWHVCNVRGESDRGGDGNTQGDKLDQDIAGNNADSEALTHLELSESEYYRNQSDTTLSRLKRSSKNRDAKCKFLFLRGLASFDARQNHCFSARRVALPHSLAVSYAGPLESLQTTD